MKIIVGLGNYGDKYAYNYHNMGFLAIQCLADRLGVKLNKRQCDSLTGEFYRAGERNVLAMPLTYMNNSGIAVRQLLARYKAEVSDLIVIFDDCDIDKATIRVRPSGSGGTHNGMRSIIDCIQSTEFSRVRIGIGKPPENVPLADYVLSDVPRAERQDMAQAIENAADQVMSLLDKE